MCRCAFCGPVLDLLIHRTVQTNPPQINLQSSCQKYLRNRVWFLTKHSESAEISGRSQNLILSPDACSYDSFLQANTQIIKGIPLIIYPAIAKYDPAAQDESPERCKFLYLRWDVRRSLMDVLSHHRVQVVSASVKCFLMDEECSFAKSLQNILHEKKSYRRFF
jgi:hypothetical protein